MAGDPKVGQELRNFFIELLQDDNLRRYQSSRRAGYIASRRRAGVISAKAERVLKTGTLKQIEDHISAVEGSGRAVPLLTVCPPM